MPPRQPKASPKPKRQVKAASEGVANAAVVRSDILDPMAKPERRGRPTTFTAEIADEICKRISEGETLRQVCKSDHMPGESTVRAWVIDDREGFYAQYARARDLCLESWADEVMDICDDASNDWMERNDSDGQNTGWAINGEAVSRSRLRIDSRKWLLSKLKPSVYGDKTLLAGHDGNALAQPVIHVSTNTPSSS